MNTLKLIGCMAAMLFSGLSMITMWTMAAASLANNTSVETLRRVQVWVLCFTLLLLAGIGTGIWQLTCKRYGLAASLSLLPVGLMFIAIAWQIIRDIYL